MVSTEHMSTEERVRRAFAAAKGATRTLEGVARELGLPESKVREVILGNPTEYKRSSIRPGGTMTVVTLRNGTKK